MSETRGRRSVGQRGRQGKSDAKKKVILAFHRLREKTMKAELLDVMARNCPRAASMGCHAFSGNDRGVLGRVLATGRHQQRTSAGDAGQFGDRHRLGRRAGDMGGTVAKNDVVGARFELGGRKLFELVGDSPGGSHDRPPVVDQRL